MVGDDNYWDSDKKSIDKMHLYLICDVDKLFNRDMKSTKNKNGSYKICRNCALGISADYDYEKHYERCVDGRNENNIKYTAGGDNHLERNDDGKKVAYKYLMGLDFKTDLDNHGVTKPVQFGVAGSCNRELFYYIFLLAIYTLVLL